jgi:flagellar motor switch protein FliM
VKAQHLFIAERALAQHCAELLRRTPEPTELLPAFAKLGERLARLLGPALAPLCGGEAPIVSPKYPREAQSDAELTESATLAAHCLMVTGTPDQPLLVTIEAASVLRMVDRAFGGRGEVPSPLPATFPLSADLFVARLEALIAAQLSLVLGGEGRVLTRQRGTSLADLAPFAPATQLAVIECEVMEGLRAPWTIRFTFTCAGLGELLDQGSRKVAKPRGAANPAAEPFGDVPLPLRAVLVDMPVSMATLAALAPGAVLPIAVARAVPLQIGGRTLASGTVGSQDDRVALQLTTLA